MIKKYSAKACGISLLRMHFISSVSNKYEIIQTDGYRIHRQMTTTCTNRFAFPHKYLKNLSRDNLQISLLVKKCLFVWVLSSHSRPFHSYEDVTITAEGFQSLTYARHTWPFISKGSSPCHTYCDTGHPSSKNRDTYTYCRAFRSGAVTTCFYDLGQSRLGFEQPTFRLKG